MHEFATATLLILSTAGCSDECLHPPCPLPIALEVVVTSASSGKPVPGASLDITGAISSTVPCDSSCRVGGYADSYTLNVTAPGFQPAARTVVVRGTSTSCGCPSAQTQQVSFALTPIQ